MDRRNKSSNEKITMINLKKKIVILQNYSYQQIHTILSFLIQFDQCKYT